MNNQLWSIVADRRFRRGPVPWVVLLLLLVNVGVWRWQAVLAEKHRKNLTAGDAGAFDCSNARFDSSYGQKPLSTWQSIPDARKQPLVILSGMSQLISINERQPGDRAVCEEMDERLAPQGVRVHGLAAPNLCNEEALFQVLALLSRPETTPRTFLFGFCFGKMRDIDLRRGYQEFLQAKPELQAVWKQTSVAYREKYRLATDKMNATMADLQTIDRTDDSLEGRLREAVGAFVPLVAARKELNATVLVELYALRNEVLGIKTFSKRPIIKHRYDMNQEFFLMMADICERAGVQLIPFVNPFNPLAENPYVPEEYAMFKEWLGGVVKARSLPYANLENLVPPEDWGLLLGDPDFMHFKGAGHRKLAARLVEEFGPALIAKARR